MLSHFVEVDILICVDWGCTCICLLLLTSNSLLHLLLMAQVVPYSIVFIGRCDLILRLDLSALLAHKHVGHIDIDHFLTVNELFLIVLDEFFQGIYINHVLGIKHKVSDIFLLILVILCRCVQLFEIS
jgi:hypothetical protein